MVSIAIIAVVIILVISQPAQQPKPPEINTLVQAPPYCGDESCDAGENRNNCFEDCLEDSGRCGDDVCGPDEDLRHCPECSICGDGNCTTGEGCDICPQDCGECVNQDLQSYLSPYVNLSYQLPVESEIKGAISAINTSRIYWEGNSFHCKPSGEPAQWIELFHYYRVGVAGFSSRHAYVCGDHFWIMDSSGSFGSKLYGPFEK